MNKTVCSRVIAASFVVVSSLIGSGSAQAISHANKFSMPLTLPYAHCGTETSETDCNGVHEPLSPWQFTQGTVEVEHSAIGLKLDDITLRYSGSSDDATCSDVGGGASACRCWDDDGTLYCDDNGDCGSSMCGPNTGNSTDNNYFKVKVWIQAYAPGGVLCGNGGICPHIEKDGCTMEASFDVKHTSGSKNEDVDQSVSATTTDCGSTYYGDFKREIRHVEVYDKWDNVVAVGTTY
jgi:hypothetical protein